jgi:hypothetical protein
MMKTRTRRDRMWRGPNQHPTRVIELIYKIQRLFTTVTDNFVFFSIFFFILLFISLLRIIPFGLLHLGCILTYSYANFLYLYLFLCVASELQCFPIPRLRFHHRLLVQLVGYSHFKQRNGDALFISSSSRAQRANQSSRLVEYRF